ncbi:hypothetical protein J7M28_03020 [bacterium]|nr:hypothetical protein [bacterium]
MSALSAGHLCQFSVVLLLLLCNVSLCQSQTLSSISLTGHPEKYNARVSPESLYSLAEGLFGRDDYEAAAVQYRLLLELFPEFREIKRCRMKIALCHLLLGEYERSIWELDCILSEKMMESFWDESRLWQGLCLYRNGNIAGARDVWDSVWREAAKYDLRAYASYFLAWDYYILGKPKIAVRYLTALAVKQPPPGLAGLDFQALSDAFKDTSGRGHKSPLAAGLLSAVLPGTGHIYCERYQDGVVAFVLNAAFTVASVECFRKKVYSAGGVSTSVELIWYSGTIYGAVNAAHGHNRLERERHLDGLREIFGDERSLLPKTLYN